MNRPKVHRIAQPPAVLCDCGHWDGNPYQHNESGRKRDFTACRNCHEKLLSRDMRLYFASQPKESSE